MAESDTTAAVNVLLADDHPAVRYGLRRGFEWASDITIVAEASSTRQAIEQAQQIRPQVAIVDVQFPDSSGIEVCQQIVKHCPETAVLILTAFDWDVYLVRAWTAGAAGFILKTVELDKLIETVRQVAKGKRLFTPDQLQHIWAWRREITQRLQRLTLREQEVLRLLAGGYTNPEIAKELVVTLKTVETHVSRILAKLELPSRREVIIWARRTRALTED
ncbi:MAG: DNA-binding response regulator [Anaerolineae bacterium]|nr:response regulator transcription factor [Anaerolineales bacterium]MCQ3972656.1 DNA-binding response regulator [Anaerolineae bacterium]